MNPIPRTIKEEAHQLRSYPIHTDKSNLIIYIDTHNRADVSDTRRVNPVLLGLLYIFNIDIQTNNRIR